jgi:hypothetical protein
MVLEIYAKQVAVIKEAMATKVQNGKYAHVPIIANGNITCWQDCVDNLKETQADGEKNDGSLFSYRLF